MNRTQRLRSLLPMAVLTMTAACTGFHEISEGQLYRDRQPSEDELVRAIETHGIRTVVMLRGLDEDTRSTRRATQVTGAGFVHLPMSARHAPSAEQLRALWRTIDQAPRPILFHCRAGVDRTGLAAALAVLHDSDDLAAARAQLALVPYGHVALFGTEAMDEVFDRYAPWHGSLPFEQWLAEVYPRQLAGEDVAAPR